MNKDQQENLHAVAASVLVNKHIN